MGVAVRLHLAGKPDLQAVDLHSTRVGDEGLRHLAGAVKITKLKLPHQVTDEVSLLTE